MTKLLILTTLFLGLHGSSGDGQSMSDDEDFAEYEASGHGITEAYLDSTESTEIFRTETLPDIITELEAEEEMMFEEIVEELTDEITDEITDKITDEIILISEPNTAVKQNDTDTVAVQKPMKKLGYVEEDKIENGTWWESKQILAALIAGSAAGVLFGTLFVMLCIHRMRKKDEGSYSIDTKYHVGNKPSIGEKREVYA